VLRKSSGVEPDGKPINKELVGLVLLHQCDFWPVLKMWNVMFVSSIPDLNLVDMNLALNVIDVRPCTGYAFIIHMLLGFFCFVVGLPVFG
jgi:hypothetical protein